MDFTLAAIVIDFLLLDKGHEAENLQKECLFYCITTSLVRTSVYLNIYDKITMITEDHNHTSAEFEI